MAGGMVQNRRMHGKVYSLLAVAAIVAPAFAAEWMTDLESAKTRAAREGKDVLIEFTGSDWCGPCIRMKKAVLDTPEFEAYAADKFVLLEVDVPRNPKFSKEHLKRNRGICERFHVESMPTVVVISPEGQVLGGFKGSKTEFPVVRGILHEAHENGATFREAAKREGLERARALLDVHKAIPEELRHLSTLENDVRAMDPDNCTGVRDDELREAEWKEIEASLAATGGDAAKEAALLEDVRCNAYPANAERLENQLRDMSLDRLLSRAFALRHEPIKAVALLKAAVEAEENPLVRYQLRAHLVRYQLMAAETVEDVLAAKETMLQSIEDCPDNELRIRVNAEHMFENPEALLEKSRRNRH